MKIKIKRVKVKKSHVILTAFLAGVASIGIASIIPAYSHNEATASYSEPKENIAEQITKDPVKQYVVNQAIANNLDPLELIAVIQGESGFNPNAYNVNTNGTVDLGIAQWNSIHIKSGFITVECAGNAECAIDKMIAKRLKDGNYSAWYAARKLGIK